VYAANRKRTQLLFPAFWLILLVCLICLSSNSWAQSPLQKLYLNNEIRFEHLSMKQGLSNNTVTAILQDREGFLWVGTQDGLNKFDGYTFTTYHPGTSEASNTFSFTYVTDLYEDKKGILWVSTINKGLNKLDRQTGKFISYQSDSTGKSNYNTCFAIHEDKDGIFWIPSFGGLSRFNPETGKFILYPHPVPGGYFTLISEDNMGKLWVGSQQGLYQFDPQTGKFILFSLNAVHPESSFIHSIYKDHAGILWISVYDVGLFQFNPVLKQFITQYPFHKKSLSGHQINPNAMLEDEGKLWLGTNQGLQQLDPTTGQFTTYQPFLVASVVLMSGQCIKTVPAYYG
jgi:ligand-binding sensor domain-containing protein